MRSIEKIPRSNSLLMSNLGLNTKKSQIELLTPSVNLRLTSGKRRKIEKNIILFKKTIHTEHPINSAFRNWNYLQKKGRTLEFNKLEFLSHSPTNMVMIMSKNSRNNKYQLKQINTKASLSERRDFYSFMNDLSHKRFTQITSRRKKV